MYSIRISYSNWYLLLRPFFLFLFNGRVEQEEENVGIMTVKRRLGGLGYALWNAELMNMDRLYEFCSALRAMFSLHTA